MHFYFLFYVFVFVFFAFVCFFVVVTRREAPRRDVALWVLLLVLLILGVPHCVLFLGAPHRDVASRCSLLCCCFWELLAVGGIYVHMYNNFLIQI